MARKQRNNQNSTARRNAHQIDEILNSHGIDFGAVIPEYNDSGNSNIIGINATREVIETIENECDFIIVDKDFHRLTIRCFHRSSSE